MADRTFGLKKKIILPIRHLTSSLQTPNAVGEDMVEHNTNPQDASEALPEVGETLVATESTSNLTADAATNSPLTGTSLEHPGSESNPQSAQNPEDPSQNSEETPTMKAEASDQGQNAPLAWKSELNRFLQSANGVLATKENLKLVSVDKKLNPAYVKSWKLESNRYFQLLVNLRRREKETKTGGKTVA